MKSDASISWRSYFLGNLHSDKYAHCENGSKEPFLFFSPALGGKLEELEVGRRKWPVYLTHDF